MKMSNENIESKYFDWMCNMVCKNRFGNDISYMKLLTFLHHIEFTYRIRRDRSRADDGVNLRYRFPYETEGVDEIERYINGPCSVLEMMLALAIRCEETIMDNPAYGDRTGQWFWGMVSSLGLSSMEDRNFDEEYASKVIERFLRREFETNGRGSLFTIRDCKDDLRTVEIWTTMLWYLDTIT